MPAVIQECTREMKASICLLFVLCGLSTALVREHVYVKDKKTWGDAQSHCRQYYKDLSTIKSDEEQQMLIELAGAGIPDSWIGLQRDKNNINNFLWSDGNSFSFSKWEHGQPDNIIGLQHCVATQYMWDDRACYNLFPFFCYKIVILIKERKTWEEALEYCRAHHTDLAIVTAEKQLQLIKQETMESQTDSVWTGLRFLAGEWLWMNMEPLGNQVLLPECPTIPSHCGARNTKTNKWENRDCAEKLNFICN